MARLEAFQSETYLQNKFKRFHTYGEWYSPTQEVISFIEGLAAIAPSDAGASDIRFLEGVVEASGNAESQDFSSPPIRQLISKKEPRAHRHKKKKQLSRYALGNTADGKTVKLTDHKKERLGDD
jgi:hypothetical protein